MEQYLFASARIRALENGLIGQERLERLLTANDLARAVDLLNDFGVKPAADENGRFLREETLLARLHAAYREVEENTDHAQFADVLRYPYDGNNIKAVIKCAKRGVEPDDMLFDFGTIPAETVRAAQHTHSYETLPAPFGDAAKKAQETFQAGGNPQTVDLILDRACFAAMQDAAKQTKNAFVRSYVEQKTDFTNLLICIRLLRMRSGEPGKLLLGNSLVEGGNLPHRLLTEWYEKGEAYLWDRLFYTSYDKFAAEAGSEASLTVVERAADNALMEFVKTAKMIPYGTETIFGYLVAVEYEVRNLRIVLSGIEAGLDRALIRERIRKSYV